MKITYSPLVAGASGKTADAVAAHWKGRNYIRKRVIPHNPKSSAQTAVRESLARCVTLWRSLSSTVKDYLDTYAVDYRMAGFNAFISKNRAHEQVPEALEVVPANPHVSAVADFEGDVAVADKITVTWTDPALDGYTKLALIARNQALEVFELEILTVDAADETYDFDPLETDDVYDVYGWLYNPTTGDMGTVAADTNLTVT